MFVFFFPFFSPSYPGMAYRDDGSRARSLKCVAFEEEIKLRMAMAMSHANEVAGAFASAFLLLAWTVRAVLRDSKLRS